MADLWLLWTRNLFFVCCFCWKVHFKDKEKSMRYPTQGCVCVCVCVPIGESFQRPFWQGVIGNRWEMEKCKSRHEQQYENPMTRGEIIDFRMKMSRSFYTPIWSEVHLFFFFYVKDFFSIDLTLLLICGSAIFFIFPNIFFPQIWGIKTGLPISNCHP